MVRQWDAMGTRIGMQSVDWGESRQAVANKTFPYLPSGRLVFGGFSATDSIF
ncbi:hypothetical protein CA54_33280 [Symmachiella macrocystis]|uniref:Uncharacterized protein n=1 Tax=Symmachiella macrocystis TaxID=2527985 RepID=A0A5C6BSS2_9PLAN|nr:hypothetical protein CA54_33280 [Symmachiella macrocystis]